MSAVTAHRPSLMPIEQVVALLAGRIDALVRELLPHGVRRGHEWVCGGFHRSDPGQGLSVHLSGAKAGVWAHFSGSVKGDALDLVAQARFGGNKADALRWSRGWLGLDNSDPARMAVVLRQAEQHAERREAQAAEDAERSRRSAQAIWLGAQPSIIDTPVESYLAGRNIDLSVLGRQPGAIRYHPALWCTEAERKLPAMVTLICGPDGAFMACHRTWLEQAGRNDWRKARLQQPKKVLGLYRGGQMRLWRGAGGKPIAKAPPGSTVDITEGVEDGLSVATLFPEQRVVAAISLSNLGHLVFPPAITSLHIWRQADTKPAAIAAYERGRDALRARGLIVLEPSLPEGFKDINDFINGKRSHG